MNKLSLNFFGELAEIPGPSSLQSLYTEIVSKFSFDPSDVSEFLLYYTKNHQKIFIKTNDDFLCFLTENIPTIMIDIPEQSRLYKAQMKELENKANEYFEEYKRIKQFDADAADEFISKVNEENPQGYVPFKMLSLSNVIYSF